MEEKLNDLMKLKHLQNRVLTLREEIPPIYSKALQKESKLEVYKLLNSQVKVTVKRIDIPAVTPINLENFKIPPRIDFTKLIERFSNLNQCLQYVKKD